MQQLFEFEFPKVEFDNDKDLSKFYKKKFNHIKSQIENKQYQINNACLENNQVQENTGFLYTTSTTCDFRLTLKFMKTIVPKKNVIKCIDGFNYLDGVLKDKKDIIVRLIKEFKEGEKKTNKYTKGGFFLFHFFKGQSNEPQANEKLNTVQKSQNQQQEFKIINQNNRSNTQNKIIQEEKSPLVQERNKQQSQENNQQQILQNQNKHQQNHQPQPQKNQQENINMKQKNIEQKQDSQQREEKQNKYQYQQKKENMQNKQYQQKQEEEEEYQQQQQKEPQNEKKKISLEDMRKQIKQEFNEKDQNSQSKIYLDQINDLKLQLAKEKRDRLESDRKAAYLEVQNLDLQIQQQDNIVEQLNRGKENSSIIKEQNGVFVIEDD